MFPDIPTYVIIPSPDLHRDPPAQRQHPLRPLAHGQRRADLEQDPRARVSRTGAFPYPLVSCAFGLGSLSLRRLTLRSTLATTYLVQTPNADSPPHVPPPLPLPRRQLRHPSSSATTSNESSPMRLTPPTQKVSQMQVGKPSGKTPPRNERPV